MGIVRNLTGGALSSVGKKLVPRHAAGFVRGTLDRSIDGVGSLLGAARQANKTLASNDGDLAARVAERARKSKVAAQTQVDSAWIRRLDALLGVGKTALLLLGSVLAVALIAVTFNTIRLQILTQRDEIEVSRLVGATDAYVRRPFLYLGGVLGALGGIAALAIVA